MLEALGLTVPLVLLAMYALMAAFLRSYWKPLVAVVGIPIAFAGAVLGHWALGWDFTAMSLFGVVGVAGRHRERCVSATGPLQHDSPGE